MELNPSSNVHGVLDDLSQIELLVIQGKLSQAKTLYEAHKELHAHPTVSTRADLQYYQALILHAEMDYKGSLAKAESSFGYFRSTSDNKKIGRLQKLIARIQMDMGELEQAEQTYRDCLATWRRIDDKIGIFDCHNRLAQIKFIRGEYEASAKFLLGAIENFRSSAKDNINAEITLVRYYGNLARIYALVDKWDEAEKLLRECIEHNRRCNVNDSLIRNLLSLGYLGIRTRNQRLCEDCFAEAKSLLDSTQLKKEEAILYEYLGEYYAEFNKFELALQAFQMALKSAEKLVSPSILISQTLRRRAEVYLATGRPDKAYAEAQKSLKIAREVGEKVEEAASLKVLALASSRQTQTGEEPNWFSEAEAAYAGISEKYEIAKMHLAFSSVEPKGNDIRKVRWCQDHLKEARRIFQELGVGYYTAIANLIDAQLAVGASDYDYAFKVIAEAENYFEMAGSEEDVAQVFAIRRRVEMQMVDFAASDSNEYHLVRTLLNPSEYRDLRQGDLTQNLRFLAEKISADQALVAIYDFATGELKSLAGFQFDPDKLSGLLEVMKYAGIKPNSLKPFFITSPYASSNGSAELFRTFKEVGSMILIPLDLGSRKAAIIYLQRNGSENTLGFFGKADLNLSMAFADMLAFRAMEEEKKSLEQDNLRLQSQLEDRCAFPNIIASNQEMLKMLEKIIQVKDSSISLLIQGETGSGKDLVAKTIHYNSIRKDKRFISVNCAALPETLLESELFGYKKGAFTGADRDRAGLFEEADGGTFFLDEIGEMPLSIQAKLLRVLEDQEVVRLGDTHGHKVDVRILSATNRDLKEMLNEGRFRQDLYYRLSAMTLRIPSLRERHEDIPLLISHFLAKYDPQVRMDPEVRQILINFSWPGNIRELDNEIKKLVLLSGEKKMITQELLSKKFFREPSDIPKVELPEVEKFRPGFTLYDYIALFEKKCIRDALARNRWVKKHAANELGIPESTLRLKIKEYLISKE